MNDIADLKKIGQGLAATTAEVMSLPACEAQEYNRVGAWGRMFALSRQTLRVYADSSVLGGVFDEEFREPSRRFFHCVREGLFRLVVSDVVRREVADAPAAVKDLLDDFLRDAEVVEVTTEALRVRDAYIAAHILTRRCTNDALHVALATVNECAMIVSWNFKHIVHYEKIPLYNAVNRLQGYGTIQIYSPLEVVGYGNEDKDV